MKKILAIAGILSVTISLISASDAAACSPQKLRILKERCENAKSPMQKKAFCAMKANPHGTKFVNEKNYNVR